MKRSSKLLLAGLVVVGTDQALNHTVLADGWLMGLRVAPFDPPTFTPQQVRRVADMRRADGEALIFDPDLGWCPAPDTEAGAFSYDWAGARVGAEPFPRARRAGTRRVVAVGCSFTHGDEVRGTETWASRLNARDDLDLANLGVAGYGLGQAWMRWRRDGVPLDVDEVWIGWLPAASLRVVNLYPPILRHWTGLTLFKPRFRLGPAGELVPVPPPVGSAAEFVQLFDDADRRLRVLRENDAWVRRAPAAYAAMGSHPLHRSALGRVALTFHERRGRSAAARVADPASDVHRLLGALLHKAAAETGVTGVRARLLVLPSRPDLERAQRGERYWSALCQEATELMPVLDLTDALEAAGARTDDGFWAPDGHYSARAHAVVAEAVGAAWLGTDR